LTPELRAWLLDGEPLPEGLDVAELLAEHPDADALLAELNAVSAAAASLPFDDPPAWLDAAVLAAAAAEPRQAQPLPRPANRAWRLGAAAVAVTAVAAAAAFVARAPVAPDVRQMTPRGATSAPRDVELKVAVRARGSEARRARRGEPLAQGDTLLFRYDQPADAWLTLVRIDERGATVLHEAGYGSGEGELEINGQALGYQIEPGEGAAAFALLASDRALDPDAIASSLGPALSAPCDAAGALDAGCDAFPVGLP
jgi:hypothetical protein